MLCFRCAWPGVVPVAGRRLDGKAGEKLGEIGVDRQLLEPLAVLEAKAKVLFLGVVEDAQHGFLRPLPVGDHALAELAERLVDQGPVGLVTRSHGVRMLPAVRGHVAVGREPEIPHAPQVADQERGVHLGREVDRALRLAQPLLPLLRVGRRGLEKIGRRVDDAHRKRAEIVRRTDLDHALLHGLQDPGHERDPDAVAQLDMARSPGRRSPSASRSRPGGAASTSLSKARGQDSQLTQDHATWAICTKKTAPDGVGARFRKGIRQRQLS